MESLPIFNAILSALEALHERGCCGCLKPENIFVNGIPKLADLGLVGYLNPQEFELNASAKRYLPYMAPELKKDWSHLVPQSDLYSVGAIFYEVLVGRPPLNPLRVPSEISGIYEVSVDEFILQALATKPEDRFPTAGSMSSAFQSLLPSLQRSLEKALKIEENKRSQTKKQVTAVPELTIPAPKEEETHEVFRTPEPEVELPPLSQTNSAIEAQDPSPEGPLTPIKIEVPEVGAENTLSFLLILVFCFIGLALLVLAAYLGYYFFLSDGN